MATNFLTNDGNDGVPNPLTGVLNPVTGFVPYVGTTSNMTLPPPAVVAIVITGVFRT